MRMYIDWFDTERISTGKISIVGATAPHTLSSRGGIKLVYRTRLMPSLSCRSLLYHQNIVTYMYST